MVSSLDRLRDQLKRRGVATDVIDWWGRHRRALPWRALAGAKPDPYRVWLSEVLLQQTTATGAAPYFLEFVRRWPTVEALGAAPLEAVMQSFAGLGYYSRARNLHACAQAVAAAGGQFPRREADLLRLPGIGPYTAAAIAAIAFDEAAAPIDGNIARILSRLMAFETPVARNRPALESAAVALTPLSRPGDYAQALMDIGATICRPRNPDCERCPLARACLGRRAGAPESFPSKGERKARPARVGAAFYVERADGAFLARRRPPRGLLGSTMELPGGSWVEGEIQAVDASAAPFAASWRRLPGYVEHVFTHFSLRLALYAAPAPSASAPPGMVWINPNDIGSSGFSGLMKKAALSAASEFRSPAFKRRSNAPSAKTRS